MIIYTIYKVVNKINGKVYIGFDSNWPNRKQQHIYNSNCTSPNYLQKRNYKFYRALRKYALDDFDWEILYQSIDAKHSLKMESFFISEYDAFENGYNSTLGGEGTFGLKQTAENKKLQSERRTQLNLKSKWYNNGETNLFRDVHPGPGWKLGRINQKSSTIGRKWYNNGKINKLYIHDPGEGWNSGMLNR